MTVMIEVNYQFHTSAPSAYLLQFQVLNLFFQLPHGDQLDEFPHAGEEDESGAAHQGREKHDGEDVLSHYCFCSNFDLQSTL